MVNYDILNDNGLRIRNHANMYNFNYHKFIEKIPNTIDDEKLILDSFLTTGNEFISKNNCGDIGKI